MQSTRIHFLTGFALVLFILCPYLSNAQYFVAGQDPASIQWRQIQTENFQVIYPAAYEDQAQKAAHVFERVFDYSGKSLHHRPKKISVIIHTSTARSNGFVAWSPSRVELYPTPYQEMYAQDWTEQLAIHELRHHVQIDKIERELPAILKILLGEQAAALVVGAYLPFWFLEGDAVVAETAMSQAGRGRLPSFSMELKAQADEKGIYSLDKAYLGSYKDYIPDYYQLGYQMVSNIRNQYGGEVWSDVLHYIARHPFGLTSLSKGLRLSTGKNQDEHYYSVMNNLKSTNPFRFSADGDSVSYRLLPAKPDKYYTSYLYPCPVDDSTFVALKISIDKAPRIVRIGKNGHENVLFEPGSILEQSMSYSNGRIAWMEICPDPRWTNKERSLLRILDIQRNALWEKVYNQKFQAPSLSPDGQKIAVVQFNGLNLCSIVLLNREDGHIMHEFRAPGNNVFFTPSWSSDEKHLYAVELGQNGKSLVRIDTGSGVIDNLTKPSEFEVIKPVQSGRYLYFTSNFGGKNEGYAYDLGTQKTYRILTSKYGIRDLRSAGKDDTFIYGDYSSSGFKIAQKEARKPTWTELTAATDGFRDTLAQHLTRQENGAIDFSDLDTSNFVSSRYSKIKNLFNIHSWSPVYIDSDQSAVNAGFSVVSQNKLTTAITQFGYDYSTVNQTGKWVGKFEYSGWYPVLSFYGDYGNERDSYYQVTTNHSTGEKDTISVSYIQKVLNLRLDASVPFNFSRGKMYRMVEPEIQMGYSHYWQDESAPSSLFRGSYVPLTFRLYAHNLKQQSHRDLQPSWGQLLELNYKLTPFGDKQLGKIVSAEGVVYLPGIINHQGIRIYSGYQRKISDDHYFSDLISYPRGYANMANNQLFTWRSDYSIPLFSPDWHIWRLYYLKRVALKVHYDVARISALVRESGAVSSIDKKISSLGAELMTECHFLRFFAPVKLGVRESYLVESNSVVSEFIISLNLRGM